MSCFLRRPSERPVIYGPRLLLDARSPSCLLPARAPPGDPTGLRRNSPHGTAAARTWNFAPRARTYH